MFYKVAAIPVGWLQFLLAQCGKQVQAGHAVGQLMAVLKETHFCEQAAGVPQAYPFIVRKVLRDAGPSSSLLLRDLVLDAGGSVRPARLSALLNAALGRVAARADGFVDFDAVPAESASVQARPAWA